MVNNALHVQVHKSFVFEVYPYRAILVIVREGLLENHLSDGADKTVLHGIEFVYDKPFIVMILDFLVARNFLFY